MYSPSRRPLGAAFRLSLLRYCSYPGLGYLSQFRHARDFSFGSDPVAADGSKHHLTASGHPQIPDTATARGR